MDGRLTTGWREIADIRLQFHLLRKSCTKIMTILSTDGEQRF
jgi:hypothetical protein